MRAVRRASLAAVIAVVATAAPGAAVAPGTAAPSAAVAPGTAVSAQRTGETQEIGSATAGDFRVVLTAVKQPDGSGMPPATVEAEGFRQRDGSWKSIGTVLVEKAAFWNTVTGLDGLCEFAVADTPEPRAEVRIRYGPSLGCAPVDRFHVESGRLVRG